ncbi:MAG: hypothetical protein ACAI43_00940 [Phycisphaerae bacterium]
MRHTFFAALLALAPFAYAEEKPAEVKPAAPAIPAPPEKEDDVCHVEVRGLCKTWSHQAFGQPAITVRAGGADFQIDYTAVDFVKTKGIAHFDGKPVIVKGNLIFKDHAGKPVPVVTARTMRVLSREPADDATPPKKD